MRRGPGGEVEPKEHRRRSAATATAGSAASALGNGSAEAADPEARHIFLNYRRADGASQAGHIYDRLVQQFGRHRVFLDVEALEPGVDYVEGLEREIGRCAALLVVIGHNWLSMTGPTGVRRIDEPTDFVRLEIEAALNRGVRVIPVLVDGAVMPEPDELPESIASVGRRQAVEVRNAPYAFNVDMDRLSETLQSVLIKDGDLTGSAASSPQQQTPKREPQGEARDSSSRPTPPRTGSRGSRVALLAAVLLFVGGGAGLYAGGILSPAHASPPLAPTHSDSTPTSTPTASPTTPAPPNLTACDQNISAGPYTSCPFAENVFVAYYRDWRANGQEQRSTITAYSPVTHLTYTMACANDGTTVVCTGGVKSLVTFPFRAIEVY